jgi:hypothetical protein
MPVNQFLRERSEARTLRLSLQELAMSSSNRSRDDVPAGPEPAATGATPPAGADAYANWLDRMQRARARQAAITRNLYTWSNYKSWADQVRDSWQNSDSGLKAPTSPPTKSPKK